MRIKYSRLTEILERNFLLYENNLALKNSDQQYTYKQLDLITNQIANHLSNKIDNNYQSAGIPLLFNNRLFFVLTVIALLKIGRAYVPIDISYPGHLIHHILLDTDNTCFISDDVDNVLLNLNSQTNDKFDSINFFEIYQPTEINENIKIPILQHKDDVACVMYTSGSTGKSKGVIIPHKAIISRTYNPEYIALSSKDVFFSHSSLAFDASSFEIWGALLNGATLVCMDHITDLLDYKKFQKTLDEDNITILWQTTSLFNHYVSQGHSNMYDCLRFLLIGGEQINKKILKRYLLSNSRKCAVMNGYGPTENTIFSAVHFFDNEANINDIYEQVAIGKPVDRTTIMIVNDKKERVSIGEIGELLLSGDGLAKGYLNKEDLTKERFVKHSDALGTYYHSGDLGYYGEDGLIYYVGRKDTQVKINGFRIELEEVANAVLTFPDVEEVIIKPIIDGNKYLAAYFTTFKQNIALEEIKIHLVTKIPTYMIPKYFVIVSEFPRNDNQKVSLDKLPHPLEAVGLLVPSKISDNNLIGLEESLSDIWENLLGHNEFTLESNFFDVGGDSIKIMALADKIEVQFDKRINIIDLYKNSNISNIVNNILRQDKFNE